ncbi:MAG: prolyl oligopeptidase family serine peptidase [Prevotella sp.]|nr:prolyl oligopeptidase family serine peptidase [Prevotella sp.]
MKHHLLILLTFLFTGLSSNAQGTTEDYKRAYSLESKFGEQNVRHWAHRTEWKDSTHILTYYIDSDSGRIHYEYDAETKTRRQVAAPQRPFHRPRFGRHHERHWMEVDEEKEARPVLSPDGKSEAWIEGHNVVMHAAGLPYSVKRVLSQDGTIGCYYSNQLLWSPDSRYIFVCKRTPVEKRYVYYVETSPSDQLQPILHQQEYAKPGDALPQRIPVIFDTQTGRRMEASTTLCPRQYELGSFAWSKDSREVTMEYNERGHQTYRVLAMSAQTGDMRTIIEETAPTFVNYTRHFRHDLTEKRQIIWMSERDNWNHLYLYDMDKGSVVRQITKGEWCVRQVVHVDEQNNLIYFSASGMKKDEDPYLVRYYRIGIDGRDLRCLTPVEGQHEVRFSKDYRYLADTWSMVNQAPITVLRDARDGTLLDTIEVADISRLTSNGWKAPEVFVAKGRDGKTDMWGIIQRPTNFDPSLRYPVIEYIYSGPGSAYTPKSFTPFNWNMTSLAELGFIVVQLDGMGTSWRGKKFEEVCYKNLKDAGLPDRKLWIQAAAERYPYMDADNVGIFGASAGGQESSTAVLLHGDFYKAAYSSCGCHDNRMDKIWWNEQWMGYPVDSSYVESSNVYHADKLKRPLMLVVGEMDDNVDPASTYQLVNALVKAGKDFELVVLPGTGHTMGERYGEHKRFDFFVRHLLHRDPPKWDEIK